MTQPSTFARVADGRTKFQLVIDQEQLDAVREYADLEGMTASEWVRRVIERAVRARARRRP
jgi:hypothetical protein